MLDVIKILAQEDTPSVILDKENEIFEIGHRSLPENAIAFYDPILNWLNEYKNNPLPKTVFNFKLEYFNTASAKQLAKILLLLQEIAQQHDVLIRWHYLKDDTDMHASGIRFSKLLKVAFEFIEM